MSKGAALAQRFLTFSSRFAVKVITPPEAIPGEITVRCHPMNLKEAKGIFSGDLTQSTVVKISETAVFASALSTVFKGVVIAGLVAGKGPTRATADVLERALPDDPLGLYILARTCKIRAQVNLSMLKTVKAVPRAESGEKPPTQGPNGGKPPENGGKKPPTPDQNGGKPPAPGENGGKRQDRENGNEDGLLDYILKWLSS